jgi:hypothetical protein
LTIRNRLARLEGRIGLADTPCSHHRVTSIVTRRADGRVDAEPDESEIPPCSTCGRPGDTLEIVHRIVERVDGVIVERTYDSSQSTSRP